MAAAAAAGRTLKEVGGTVAAARAAAPRVKVRSNYRAAQRPVVTTMTITLGLAFLDAWLVEKKPAPDRQFLVRLAILGFILALMTEAVPKLGKGMSYLILTGVVFDRSAKILAELGYGNRDTDGTEGTEPRPPIAESPLTPQPQPVVLYQRQGPLTTEPQIPTRSRIKRPARGAAFQV